MNNKDIVQDKTFKHPYIKMYIIKGFPDCKPCFIHACLNEYVYVRPGYYIHYDSQAKNEHLCKKCFKTSKQAAIAFFRSEYRFFDLIEKING